jgi:hypothetical protein
LGSRRWLSALGHTIDLKFSCSDNFSGGVAGTGSGMLWGQEGDITYLGLLLVQSNNIDKFGYFALTQNPTNLCWLIKSFKINEKKNPRDAESTKLDFLKKN